MYKPHGIIIFGENGTGKSTLARHLAHVLGYKHMDIEDYYFKESAIPYTNPRSKEDCEHLMLADIEKCNTFVLSAVWGNFGQSIEQYYILAVQVFAQKELRLERIKQREIEKFGERVLAGGDMYERQLEFREFVANRTYSHMEQWAKSLCCPILNVDGEANIASNVALIKDKLAAVIGLLYERDGV